MSFRKQQQTEGDAATLELGPEFKNAHCLLNAEALLLLEDIQARRSIESQTIPIPPTSKVFQKCLDYLATFSRYNNKDIIREIRQTMMNDEGLAEFEMAQLGNLCPETAEEAKALIPSLADGEKEEDELQRLLDDLIAARRYQV